MPNGKEMSKPELRKRNREILPKHTNWSVGENQNGLGNEEQRERWTNRSDKQDKSNAAQLGDSPSKITLKSIQNDQKLSLLIKKANASMDYMSEEWKKMNLGDKKLANIKLWSQVRSHLGITRTDIEVRKIIMLLTRQKSTGDKNNYLKRQQQPLESYPWNFTPLEGIQYQLPSEEQPRAFANITSEESEAEWLLNTLCGDGYFEQQGSLEQQQQLPASLASSISKDSFHHKLNGERTRIKGANSKLANLEGDEKKTAEKEEMSTRTSNAQDIMSQLKQEYEEGKLSKKNFNRTWRNLIKGPIFQSLTEQERQKWDEWKKGLKKQRQHSQQEPSQNTTTGVNVQIYPESASEEQPSNKRPRNNY